MNSALDAIVCMDIKGNVILEPSGHEIFGWTEEEVMGKTIRSYYSRKL
jgi:PAS domain S-box-containing protein